MFPRHKGTQDFGDNSVRLTCGGKFCSELIATHS